jgi:hypothetical protein
MRWQSWLAWCAAKQRKYERERARWRRDHPVIDVKALEEKYGVKHEMLSVEKLKAPALVIEPEPKKLEAGQLPVIIGPLRPLP